MVDGSLVSLQHKCVSPDGQILKNEKGEPTVNIKFFLSISQWMQLFNLEEQIVKEAEEKNKILSFYGTAKKMGTGVQSFQREVSIYYILVSFLKRTR